LRLEGRDGGNLAVCAVQTLEVKQVASIINDGDADIPFVFLCLNLASSYDLLRVISGEAWFGAHMGSFFANVSV
jgi:hypothetical protein